MNKVALMRGKTVKEEFPDQYRHLITLSAINFISYFGYGVISIFVGYYEINNNAKLLSENGNGLKCFIVQVVKELLDFLIIGYPAYMHVKNFSIRNDHRQTPTASECSQNISNNLLESNKSNDMKVTQNFYQTISQVSPEENSFSAEVERLSRESNDRDSFSTDVIQALGLIYKDHNSYNNLKKQMPNFGCKNTEPNESLDSLRPNFMYKSQNNGKSQEFHTFELSEKLLGPNN